MKKLNYLLSAVVLLGVLVTVGCSKDDEPKKTAEELVTETLSSSWELSSAKLENQDITDLTGLELTISDAKTYNTNGSTLDRQPNPWPNDGTWEFVEGTVESGDDGSFQVTRGDGLLINVTLSESKLTLSFTFATNNKSSGRDEAVEGDWVMEFDAAQ